MVSRVYCWLYVGDKGGLVAGVDGGVVGSGAVGGGGVRRGVRGVLVRWGLCGEGQVMRPTAVPSQGEVGEDTPGRDGEE